jgi:hypothetical protein
VGAAPSGIAAALGLIFLLAGALKAADQRSVRDSLARVLPRALESNSRLAKAAAATLATVELALGAALLFASGVLAVAASVAVVLLCCAFVPAVVVARRRGLSCGCWGSLSRGAAGGAEVGRSIALILVAGALAAVRLTGDDRGAVRSRAAALAAVLAVAVVVGAAAVGDRLLRSPPATTRGAGLVAALAWPRRLQGQCRTLGAFGRRRRVTRLADELTVRLVLDCIGAPDGSAWRRAHCLRCIGANGRPGMTAIDVVAPEYVLRIAATDDGKVVATGASLLGRALAESGRLVAADATGV